MPYSGAFAAARSSRFRRSTSLSSGAGEVRVGTGSPNSAKNLSRPAGATVHSSLAGASSRLPGRSPRPAPRTLARSGRIRGASTCGRATSRSRCAGGTVQLGRRTDPRRLRNVVTVGPPRAADRFECLAADHNPASAGWRSATARSTSSNPRTSTKDATTASWSRRIRATSSRYIAAYQRASRTAVRATRGTSRPPEAASAPPSGAFAMREDRRPLPRIAARIRVALGAGGRFIVAGCARRPASSRPAANREALVRGADSSWHGAAPRRAAAAGAQR